MKKIAVGLLMCWALVLAQANAANAEWLTDLSKAQAKAKAEKKMVLMDFTGSDWCPPCMALHKNVFSTPAFETFAKDNLILVEVDFPAKKKLSKELAEENKVLAQKYNVEGYPTIVVLDSAGKQLMKESGYSGQGPKEFIAQIQKLKK